MFVIYPGKFSTLDNIYIYTYIPSIPPTIIITTATAIEAHHKVEPGNKDHQYVYYGYIISMSVTVIPGGRSYL